MSAGNLAPRFHPRTRPVATEGEAIERALALAEIVECPLYVVHVSTGRGAQAVVRARLRGQQAFGETCPQYLLLDETHNHNPDPQESVKLICAPPLRTAKDQQALWARLQNGGLQTVGTDHCAFNVAEQKDSGVGNFERCPGGLPSIEARLALLHTFGVRAGWLTRQQWVSVCSAAPAQIFGLYPFKESLEIGADADIVLFDPERRVKLTKSIPTANLRPARPVLILAGGVYAAWARWADGDARAVVNVGYRPTFGENEYWVEAYLLDFSGDLYDRVLTLEFLEPIRPEMTFASAAALRHQVMADIETARRVVAGFGLP